MILVRFLGKKSPIIKRLMNIIYRIIHVLLNTCYYQMNIQYLIIRTVTKWFSKHLLVEQLIICVNLVYYRC